MKILTHPDLPGKQFKMGRTRPKLRYRAHRMGDLLKSGVLPAVTVPATTNYSAAAQDGLSNIYMNDELGDCVIAGGFHVRAVTSGNSGNLVTFTNDQVVQDYSAIGGYDPTATLIAGQNPTDQGCDENSALQYWEQTGFPDGVLLSNAVSIDPTNYAEVCMAVYLFENIYFGVELPDAWVNPMPNGSGFTWDVAGDADPENGHCFVGVDITASGVLIDTWGMLGTITPAAIAQYAAASGGGQLFTLLTPDIISAVSEKSPAGYDSTTLTNYLAQLPAPN